MIKPQKLSFAQRYMAERRQGRNAISAMFTSTWNSLGFTLNTYAAVDPRNKAMRGVIGRQASAADLTSAQPYLRNLCRNYERNNASVRAAVEGLVANVVGTGIALEPDTGDEKANAKLREVWNDYIRDCFVDGMGLYSGQSLGFRDVVVAGEALWRLVIDEQRLAKDRIPLCILPLESEWLGPMSNYVAGGTDGDFIGGIKMDKFCRPVKYRLMDPRGKEEEVDAKWILHVFERRRALQVRGEPWLAPVLTTIRQEQDLVTAELEAAKNTAGFAAAITSAGGVPFDTDEKGSPVRDIELGSVVELQPGESIEMLSHTRPSQQIKPFREMLRGDEAAALRIGTRWMDRDISKANYSSMRCDMLDNERLLGPVRQWYGDQTVGKLYKAVLPYLAAKAGIPVPKRDTYRLLPDGQPYVDPEKDARAALIAIKGGLSSYEAEIAKRGGDYKQVWAKLAQEKAEAEALGLVLSVQDGDLFGGDDAVAQVKAQENAPAPQADTGDEATRAAVVALTREMLKEQRSVPVAPVIHNHLPAANVQVRNEVAPTPVEITNEVRSEAPAAPVVNVSVQPTPIQVDVAAPTVNVEQASVRVNVEAPTVNVAAPKVTVENEVTMPSRTVRATPQRDGSTLIAPID